MKTIIALLFVAGTLFNVYGQDSLDDKKSPDEKAAIWSQKLKKKLNLSDDQTLKAKEVMVTSFQKRQDIKAKETTERNARKAEMLRLEEEMNAQLKPILTPEQYDQYLVIKAERKINKVRKSEIRKNQKTK